jgi:Zn-dependent protease with chaperone function
MVIMSWVARWFDGHRSTPHAVRISIENQVLSICPDVPDGSGVEALSSVSTQDIVVGERFLGAPRMIELPDGGSLHVADDAAGGFDKALRNAGHGSGLACWLIERWSRVLACLALLIGLIVWMDRTGAGLIASFAVPFVPPSIDEQIGRSALTIADAQWLSPTQLPSARRGALLGRFVPLVRDQYPDVVWRLEFRRTRNGKDAFNAFALPGGSIVLLDGLVEKMSDEEVIAVLAHELGHVVHRDVMRGIVRQMGLLAVASVIWGQMSSLAASAATEVQGLHFARHDESAADAFAVQFLRRAGVPVRRLADAFVVMQQQERATGAAPTFLSDHPSTAARLRSAEAGAEGQVPSGALGQRK